MLSSIFGGNWSTFLFQVFIRLIVVFTALPIHEFAHGWVAYKLGDNTAKNMGRLDMNPLRHFDPFGTTCLLLTGFGWAKPVPVNPNNFKNRKSGMALTALAGPVSNILLATVILLVYKVLYYFIPFSNQFMNSLLTIFATMVSLNIGLAVFNLLPVPPLDGAKIFGFFLPDRIYWKVMQYEQFIMIALFAVLMFTNILSWPINWLSNVVYRGMNFLTGFVDVLARMIL